MPRAYGSGVYGSGIYPGTTYEEQMAALSANPIVLVEIDFPSGSQYFSSPQARFEGRQYGGELLRVGQIRRACQQNLGLYEISSVDIAIADTDKSLINLANTTTVKGTEVRIKLGSKKMPLSDFVTIFSGLIDDFGSDEYAFTFTVKDRLWTLPARPDTGYVTATLFPNALPAHIGKPLPVCYGTHSDTDTTDARNRGAWPTLFVDNTTGNRYFLIAYHAVSSINEVYAYTPGRGSVVLTETTHYVAYPNGFINGVRCAFIAITATGWTDKVTDANGTLGEVTVNVEGKETNGDGTGDLMTNPADVLLDILGNYFGSPPVDSDKFAEARLAADSRAYVAAGGYVDEMQSQDFLSQFANSFSMRIFPDRLGRISCDIFEPIGPGTAVSSFREQWEILSGSMHLDFQANIQGAEDAQVVNRVDYKHSFHWAKKTFRGNETVSDATSLAAYGEKRLTLDLPWAGNSGSALDVAYRYVALYRNPVPHMSCALPLVGMNTDLTDTVHVTHGSTPGPFSDEAFDIIEHVFDPQSFTVRARARDVATISENGYFLADEDESEVVADGTIAVTNGSAAIEASGNTSFVTADVQVGDIIEITPVTNEGNRLNLKITAVTDLNTIETAQTVWTDESGMTYRIMRSWLTNSTAEKRYGHLCADDTTGEFSNADDGFGLL